MARPLRLAFGGGIYHVTARGNERKAIVRDDTDRARFVGTLAAMVDRYRVRCHAWVLMDNHYHLLLETPSPNLSLALRLLNGVYTQAFNRRHRRVGHLFQGRFKAIVVEKEAYLLELCRSMVLHPVRAAMVSRPDAYRWSRYRATAGLANAPVLLTRDWLLAQFGQPRDHAERKYREFVKAGRDAPSPWERLQGQLLLGSDTFLGSVKPLLVGKAHVKEVPRAQRFAQRPELAKAVPLGKIDHKETRDRLIREAHFTHGYRLTEIARHMGLHYTTISKIVNQPEAGGEYCKS